MTPEEVDEIASRVRREKRHLFGYAFRLDPTDEQIALAEVRRRRVLEGLEIWGRRRRLRPGENPLLEAIDALSGGNANGALMDGWGAFPGAEDLTDARTIRHKLARTFAWAVPSDEALAGVVARSPIVEVCAGTGYWAALLRNLGADVVATDVKPGQNDWTGRRWTRVEKMSATLAAEAHSDRTLLIVWPPYERDDASLDALLAYRGDRVIYVGEGGGGCTGSKGFHEELDERWRIDDEVQLPRWPGIRDSLVEYVRRGART